MDIYRNIITSISGIIKDITEDDLFTECAGIDDAGRQSSYQSYKACKDALDRITVKWTEAMIVVTDRIVDSIIDKEVSLPSRQQKEEMKKVVKDHLHKSLATGDISAYGNYITNYGHSNNPIIKQAFHLISTAEQQTAREVRPKVNKLIKFYKKADKPGKRAGWMDVMAERDKHGNFTGNWVRDLNHGQYEKDLNEFKQKLDKAFDSKYNHHYIYDVNGVLINNVTRRPASEEEWENGVAPHIIEYWDRLYQWKCKHANLRYTYDYYKERMSEPYDVDEDPATTNNKIQKHGLSPKTLVIYNSIQSRINYFLDLCMDDEDGMSHPEDLSPEDKKKLDDAYEELNNVSNPFNDDGSYKDLEDRKVAFEIRSWQKFINERTYNQGDLDAFFDAATKARNKSIAENNPKLYSDFLKYNATYTVNPAFLRLVFGDSVEDDINSILYKAKILKASLQSLVRDKSNRPILTRDLEKFTTNIGFWLSCKSMDEVIEQTREKKDIAFAKKIKDNFDFLYIKKTNQYGQMIDRNTG
jgi:hypothetical protein